jgi:hypothetical protein
MRVDESCILSSIYVIGIKIYFEFIFVTINKTSGVVMEEVEFLILK